MFSPPARQASAGATWEPPAPPTLLTSQPATSGGGVKLISGWWNSQGSAESVEEAGSFTRRTTSVGLPRGQRLAIDPEVSTIFEACTIGEADRLASLRQLLQRRDQRYPMTQDEVLRIFRDSGALLEGHFILRSGLHSRQYFQCALALQQMPVVEKIGARARRQGPPARRRHRHRARARRTGHRPGSRAAARRAVHFFGKRGGQTRVAARIQNCARRENSRRRGRGDQGRRVQETIDMSARTAETSSAWRRLWTARTARWIRRALRPA